MRYVDEMRSEITNQEKSTQLLQNRLIAMYRYFVLSILSALWIMLDHPQSRNGLFWAVSNVTACLGIAQQV